ncbi:MAG TPA: hypothetical protein VF526_22650 [Solirubrobacteraceae bacterium]
MAVRLRFRCQFCDCRPDPLTQLSLEKTVAQIASGTYVDAMPEKWLVWHGRGPYGPMRYACPDHRGDLVAYLREHYGTLGPHPWKRPPYPTEIHSTDRERDAAKNLPAIPRRGDVPPVQ